MSSIAPAKNYLSPLPMLSCKFSFKVPRSHEFQTELISHNTDHSQFSSCVTTAIPFLPLTYDQLEHFLSSTLNLLNLLCLVSPPFGSSTVPKLCSELSSFSRSFLLCRHQSWSETELMTLPCFKLCVLSIRSPGRKLTNTGTQRLEIQWCIPGTGRNQEVTSLSYIIDKFKDLISSTVIITSSNLLGT